ncbi:MAG: cyclopropane fatty acyl phospholipid synthase [Desulfobulbaceae bacterium]|nr:MAG: cyclopropane fatty acyl phospholipid synthase [Desulfobulbaceae bacterium]
MSIFRDRFEELLSFADVRINGDRPWDLQVHDEKFYSRTLAQGSLGLGESYVDGWWDCNRLDEFFHQILRAKLYDKVKSWKDLINVAKAKLYNRQNRARAFQVGEHHYDIGNNLYRCMLDDRMIYSCGYWQSASCLDEAQEAKLDLVCRKLGIKPGMRVLDIGCGWGGTAKFIAENYQAEVVGITVSQKQAQFAKEHCKGLPIDIRLQDYRSLDESFACILSIGMFEHVGCKNYQVYMRTVRRNLKDDGLFLLHTIGGNQTVTATNTWLDRYIFPNYMIPSSRQISAAAEGVFVLEDWHNFGVDYDKTLIQWFHNFDRNWPALKNDYDERFYRMWKYYLLSCAGSFRARINQVWQIVFSPEGVPRGYAAVR